MEMLKGFKASNFWKQVLIRFTVFIYEIHRGLRQSWLYHRLALALRALITLNSRQSDERALARIGTPAVDPKPRANAPCQ